MTFEQKFKKDPPEICEKNKNNSWKNQTFHGISYFKRSQR